MEDLFFNFIKEEFEKDPILAEKYMQRISSACCLKAFRNIPEAIQSLKKGNVIVGFSLATKDEHIGVAFDNAYRIKDGMLESYKFIPNLTQRPFEMIPHSRLTMLGCGDDWYEELLGSQHHGFVLGDGSLVDLKKSKDFYGNKF